MFLMMSFSSYAVGDRESQYLSMFSDIESFINNMKSKYKITDNDMRLLAYQYPELHGNIYNSTTGRFILVDEGVYIPAGEKDNIIVNNKNRDVYPPNNNDIVGVVIKGGKTVSSFKIDNLDSLIDTKIIIFESDKIYTLNWNKTNAFTYVRKEK